MKSIDYKAKNKMLIHYNRVKPFANVCKVTGTLEYANAEVEYIPNDKVIDICDYRRWFEGDVKNLLIEDIAQELFDEIQTSINPKYLCVRIYLEGNPMLTDWFVEIKTNN